MAAYRRDMFGGTVIAVTGSNGKTVVKEWLSDVIASVYPVVRSPRSYNSQTGVPLSVWKLNDNYRYGIFEAGMSKPGEISSLQKIIRPQIGIFTNIGEAHQENFPDIRSKVSEKLSLFIDSGTLIFCNDQDAVREAVEADRRLSDTQLFRWSAKDDRADVLIKHREGDGGNTFLDVSYGEISFSAGIPFTDRASVENASSVVAALLCMGFGEEVISKGIGNLYPVAMRMEQKEGINGSILIEDYYNSDPVSLSIALDYLRNIPSAKKTLIITDILQSNRLKEDLYGEVSRLSARAGITRVIGIGKNIGSCRHLFPDNSLFFSSTADFEKWFSPSGFKDEAILIKGARIYRLEDIARLLEKRVHQTRLEVDLNDVLFNLNMFRSKLPPETSVMAMIKAFAYGAGPNDIAEWLNYNGIDYFAVAYTDEGISLREGGVTNRIMVMSPEENSFRALIANDLEPELYSIDIIRKFANEAEKNGLQDYPVHIKLDTGMHRLGLSEDETDELAAIIKGTSSIKVESVFTHLASSEDPSHDNLTRKQVEKYIEMADNISGSADIEFRRHVLNSSGILRFPEYHFDMVRLGIGLYGISEVKEVQLRKAISFKTHIVQVKKVKAGEGISYGYNDISDRERTIATVPVGYADGLNRLLGNGRGRMFVKGKKVPVAGNICMDMCMLDVTGMEVSPGDEVEVFGKNIDVSDIAEACGTIPYEILTGIPPRVRRVYHFE